MKQEMWGGRKVTNPGSKRRNGAMYKVGKIWAKLLLESLFLCYTVY